jgi:hypothetical protein
MNGTSWYTSPIIKHRYTNVETYEDIKVLFKRLIIIILMGRTHVTPKLSVLNNAHE